VLIEQEGEGVRVEEETVFTRVVEVEEDEVCVVVLVVADIAPAEENM
jgi:hypothetical protein